MQQVQKGLRDCFVRFAHFRRRHVSVVDSSPCVEGREHGSSDLPTSQQRALFPCGPLCAGTSPTRRRGRSEDNCLLLFVEPKTPWPAMEFRTWMPLSRSAICLTGGELPPNPPPSSVSLSEEDGGIPPQDDDCFGGTHCVFLGHLQQCECL